MTSLLSRFARLAPVVFLVVAAGCGRGSQPAPDEGAPVYSRDGRWVAFTSDRGGSYALYAARIGGAARRITDSKDDEGHYVWSPDGSRLVFSRSTPARTVNRIRLIRRVSALLVSRRDTARLRGTQGANRG
jgi:dipeptidyl aminopeptidase/acylaminoacyl peptidase